MACQKLGFPFRQMNDAKDPLPESAKVCILNNTYGHYVFCTACTVLPVRPQHLVWVLDLMFS